MVNYAYKSTGALSSVGTDLIGTNPAANNNVISHLWYNGFGATRQINYGNNRRMTLWYDAHRHQMTQMVVDNQNGTDPIISKAYAYSVESGGADNDGRIKRITDYIDSNYSVTYGYDEYNRLRSATAPAYNRSYTYDPWGNLRTVNTSNTGSGVLTTYNIPNNANGAPATNRMSSVSYSSGGSTAYTWDAAGNMTGEGATSFQYDAASRLKTVNNGTTETNGFDGDSQRVKKVESGVTVFYVRSSVMKQTAFEVGRNGAIYRANVCAGSQKLIGQLTPDGQFYWRHESHLGSGCKLTNSAGTVVYRAEHDPHGNVLLETGSTTLTANKFTSYERDNSTGLDYANARMYSGSRGRFTKPDPAGLSAADARPQSLNRYSYASNDPVNLSDPSGLDPINVGSVGVVQITASLGPIVAPTVSCVPTGGSLIYWCPGGISINLSMIQQPIITIPPRPDIPNVPLVLPPVTPPLTLSMFESQIRKDFNTFLDNLPGNCANALSPYIEKLRALGQVIDIYDISTLSDKLAADYITGEQGTLSEWFSRAKSANGNAVTLRFPGNALDNGTRTGIYVDSITSFLGAGGLLLLLHEITHMAIPGRIGGTPDLDEVLINKFSINRQPGDSTSRSVTVWFENGCSNSAPRTGERRN